MQHPDRMVFQALSKTGLLPLVPSSDLYCWYKLIDIMYHSGVRVIEYRDALSGRGVELFTELIRYASRYPDFYIGVNTIQEKLARQYVQGGASFITSTFLKEEMAEVAQCHDVPWIPGCSSRIEVERARELGASAVSLLPGMCSPLRVTEIKEQHPGLSFIPSTGVIMKEQAIKDWVRSGVLCIRMSHQLFSARDLAVKDWAAVEQNILSVISAIKTVRRSESTSAFLRS